MNEETKPPKPKKKTTTMSGVKYEWCVIAWHADSGWKKITPKTGDFEEHLADFEIRKAQYPAGHVKSIHVCWLDDIANWDAPDKVPPYGSQESVAVEPGVMTEDVIMESAARLDNISHRLDMEIQALSPHDRREFRKFQKYLAARQRYGDAVLLKRKFWRKYLGVE